MYDPHNVYRGRYKEFIEGIDYGDIELEYSEDHHIIPRCLFTKKDRDLMDLKENHVKLSYRDHFIAHKILAEDNPENSSLISAYWRMCHGNRLVATPEEYEEVRELFINSRIGVPLSEETKKKISKSSIGKVMSSEAREKIRIAKLGNKPSKESIEKRLASMRGYKHSEETKIKISNTEKGKIVSDETKKKISIANRKRDPEYKIRLSASLKGNTNAKGIRSEESKQRMREASKGKLYPDKVCKICSKSFIGRSSRSIYCDDCKGITTMNNYENQDAPKPSASPFK